MACSRRSRRSGSSCSKSAACHRSDAPAPGHRPSRPRPAPAVVAPTTDPAPAGHLAAGELHRGTHAGPLYGIPPTGNPIEMRSIDIWRTENGEFVEHWDELNYLELFQQIGVIPALNLGDTESTT